MNVHIYNHQHDLPINSEDVPAIVKMVFDGEGVPWDEISINFIDSNESGRLHGLYFADPEPTDCMTFPMDDGEIDGYRMIGDLFICPAIAIAYANEHNLNAHIETTLYLIHGLLHLCHYDDIEEEDEQKMRQAEELYLKKAKTLDLSIRP